MNTATADEPKKDPDDKYGVKTKIAVRRWDAQGKKFLMPKEGIEARRMETNDKVYFYIRNRDASGTGQPTNGSEITDEDGTVYRVYSDGKPGPNKWCQAACLKKDAKKPKP